MKRGQYIRRAELALPGISNLENSRTSEGLLQTVVGEGTGDSGHVGVEHVDNSQKSKDGSDEASNLEETLRGGNPGVILGGETSENIVVLVDLSQYQI